MKIVQINAVCETGSTGKICASISDMLNERGIENYLLYSSGESARKNAISCSDKFYTKLQAGKSKLLGNYGFNSIKETKKMISLLEEIKPTIVHLHNIHGHDCHLERLFAYLKRNQIKVFWTFHDCWAFTGYCTHFTFEKCEKWKTECENCPQKRKFSFFFDRSKQLYNRKKAAMKGLDLTMITPSQWLADIVKQSFLKEYPVKVIHNGIDLSVFRPGCSDFRRKYDIPNSKHIVLGVAFGWGHRKGLDVFIELARRLEHEKFQIVLVGTDEKVDQILPENVISIHRTNNQKELAGIYSAADVFVNPTREDTYPTVNMEAIACGTPVVTFRTGGSPEMLTEKTGKIVEIDDVDMLAQEVVWICSKKPYTESDCTEHAASFNRDDRLCEYVEWYGGMKE